tara:strand:+ start:33 stop:908 length:876 start_codon:yes stop_codon:yes gene_type:complete
MLRKIVDKIRSSGDVEKVLLGKILAKNISASDQQPLSDHEFKVFSQWGEDGIIQFLLKKLDLPQKTFIEFGVETYRESNTRFLLMHDNWAGLVIDGAKSNIDAIVSQSIYWRYSLNAIQSFITTENIDKTITSNNISGEIGILSVDIDGNDYWVLKAIKNVNPVILITEYNSVFGSERAISIPYSSDFIRGQKGVSNLYYGASLQALTTLAEEKGYSLVGCNSNGNNAFFVRKDKLEDLVPVDVKDAFVDAKFREAKDTNGKLLFLEGRERHEEIKGLPVVNVITDEVEFL